MRSLALENPIPEQIKDPNELSDLFKKYQIVPCFGTVEQSSHSILNLIKNLTELSVSYNSCLEDISDWAFNEQCDLIQRKTLGLFDSDKEVSSAKKEKFFEELKSYGITIPNMINLSKHLNKDYEDYGNFYLLVRIISAGSNKKIELIPLSPLNTAYLAKSKLNTLIYTEKWDEEWWKIKKPKIYSASTLDNFNWTERKNVKETVIHVKNNIGSIYGVSKNWAIRNQMFIEYELAELQSKVTSTEFVSKTILLFEEVDPARKKIVKEGVANETNPMTKRMNRIRSVATNSGEEPESLIGIDYPFGGRPPEKMDLTINRDTNYNTWVNEYIVSGIYSRFSWARELSGQSFVRSNVGTSLMKDLFITKNLSVIKPVQLFYENFWHTVLNNLDIATNDNYTLKYIDLIEELIKKTQGDTSLNQLQPVQTFGK